MPKSGGWRGQRWYYPATQCWTWSTCWTASPRTTLPRSIENLTRQGRDIYLSPPPPPIPKKTSFILFHLVLLLLFFGVGGNGKYITLQQGHDGSGDRLQPGQLYPGHGEEQGADAGGQSAGRQGQRVRCLYHVNEKYRMLICCILITSTIFFIVHTRSTYSMKICSMNYVSGSCS